MWLFIHPQDTLFFRDGRPFNAGADVWTNTVFPPYPHTIYGMLRTLFAHCFLEHPGYDDLLAGILDEGGRELLGTKTEVGSLSMRGPFIARKRGKRVHLLLSPPSDLFSLPDSAHDRPVHYLMAPLQQESISNFSDMSLPFLPLGFAHLEKHVKKESLKPTSNMVRDVSLLTYLKGAVSDNLSAIRTGIGTEAFVTEEICPIIARDEHLSAREGHLALPTHIRMQGMKELQYEERGLSVEIDDRAIPDSVGPKLMDCLHARPVIHLGGEARVATVEVVDHDAARSHKELFPRIAQTGRFRTVLTSPARFSKGVFLPDFLDADLTGHWDLNGETRPVRLVAAAMNRAQAVGRWDIAGSRPRETVNMVPAGSVLFFEIPEYDRQRDEKWLLALAGQSFPGSLPGGEATHVKKGFNTFMIGAWDYVS